MTEVIEVPDIKVKRESMADLSRELARLRGNNQEDVWSIIFDEKGNPRRDDFITDITADVYKRTIQATGLNKEIKPNAVDIYQTTLFAGLIVKMLDQKGIDTVSIKSAVEYMHLAPGLRPTKTDRSPNKMLKFLRDNKNRESLDAFKNAYQEDLQLEKQRKLDRIEKLEKIEKQFNDSYAWKRIADNPQNAKKFVKDYSHDPDIMSLYVTNVLGSLPVKRFEDPKSLKPEISKFVRIVNNLDVNDDVKRELVWRGMKELYGVDSPMQGNTERSD